MSDNRPSWDDIWMRMAFCFRDRSPDPNTKHGACIVSPDMSNVSFGYNGYISGCNHEDMPKERPAKYIFTRHAEINAISNAPFCIKHTTLYVTGEPCLHCWSEILHRKISRVVIGPISSHMLQIDPDFIKYKTLMIKNHNIIIDQYNGMYLNDMINKLSENKI